MALSELISGTLDRLDIPFRNQGMGRVSRLVAIKGLKGSRVLGQFVNKDGSNPDMFVGEEGRDPELADLVKIEQGKFREI